MRFVGTVLSFALLFAAVTAAQAEDSSDAAARGDADWLLPLSEIETNEAIPPLQDVLDRGWADDVASHAEIERYLRALAEAAPDRARLVQYGESYEGRAMYYLVISSAENMARLEAIRTDNLRLADSLATPAEEADEISARLPGLVWMAYCIHGNETSGSDAALVTAYHLLADETSGDARTAQPAGRVHRSAAEPGRSRTVRELVPWSGADGFRRPPLGRRNMPSDGRAADSTIICSTSTATGI